MNEPWFYVLWTAGAYLLGSVSVGDLVARAAGVDIRGLGTGNPGTANVLREIGKRYAAAVFLGDVVKGAVATVPIYVMSLTSWAGVLAGVSLLGGHFFPVPWQRTGGTGMATAMGIAIGLLPVGVAVAAAPGIITVAATRNAAFAGALFFVLVGTVGGWYHQDWTATAGVALIAAAVAIKSWRQYRWL